MWPLTNLTPVYVYVCWLFSARHKKTQFIYIIINFDCNMLLFIYSLPEFVFVFFLSNCFLCNSNSKVCFIYLLWKSIILMMHFIVTNSYQRKLFDSLNKNIRAIENAKFVNFQFDLLALCVAATLSVFRLSSHPIGSSKQASERAIGNSKFKSNISAILPVMKMSPFFSYEERI